METTESDRYLHDLLGLGGRSGLLWLVPLETAILLLTFRAVLSPDGQPAAAAGFLLLAIAAAVVVLTPIDPLPIPHTVLVVVFAPAAAILANAGGLTHPTEHTFWTALAYHWTALVYQTMLAMLALRGRIAAAWLGAAGIALVTIVAGVVGGFDASTLATIGIPIGVVAAMTLFSFIMRPTQKALQTLRTEATLAAAAEATIAAQHAERDRQLTRLDSVARPMLERIASGVGLTNAERTECRLLEAELRDSLRAPQLATNSVAAAARGARARGVEVVLLDDGGLAKASNPVREVVIATAAQELDAANTGTVTVRVLPPGRRLLATVVAANRRMEVDPRGSVARRITP